jgi:hypothetical protein
MSASDHMGEFKSGLSEVKDKLKDIQLKISDVDRYFFSEADHTIKKQESLLELA